MQRRAVERVELSYLIRMRGHYANGKKTHANGSRLFQLILFSEKQPSWLKWSREHVVRPSGPQWRP